MQTEHILPVVVCAVILVFAAIHIWQDIQSAREERRASPPVPAATLVQAGNLLRKDICFHCRHHDTIPKGKGARTAECSECGERMQVNAAEEVTGILAFRASRRDYYNDKSLRSHDMRQRA